MRRKCAECPTWTQTVCRHVFGANWGDKSRNGEGCDFHLDDVAEAWRKAGWTPEKGTTKEISLPRRPVRPKVSANILRQAELFFGRMK